MLAESLRIVHKQVASDYVAAARKQREMDDQLTRAMAAINSNNYLFSFVNEEYAQAYVKLVQQVIGFYNWDWIDWWMWEAEFGTNDLHFVVDGTRHDPKTMTFEQFFDIVYSSDPECEVVT